MGCVVKTILWGPYAQQRDPVDIYSGLGGSQGRSGRVQNIFRVPAFDSRTMELVSIRCQLRYNDALKCACLY
jgi:hypothetical protein